MLYLKVWHGNQIDQLSGEIIQSVEKATIIGIEIDEEYETDGKGTYSLDHIGVIITTN